VGEIEPVSLIVTALASGASVALKDSAAEAIKSAYQDLKSLVSRKLNGPTKAEAALGHHENKPELHQQALGEELALAGAGSDEEIILAAKELVGLLDLHQMQSSKYSVQIHGPAQGTIIGDDVQVAQSFGSSPTHP
jgi:hypothetical protein